MNHFRECDRDTAFLLPPSVDEWLPEDDLARFVVDIVDQLDLSGLTRQYRGAGSAAYHPSMLVALLLYGYATGTYASRRIEQASYESLAFRYIAANTHPDHDTLCTFRKRFLKELGALFVQVLSIAQEMDLVKLGTVALDGTKVHANASRHSALSYGHAEKLEAQLQAEVKELLARAEAAESKISGHLGSACSAATRWPRPGRPLQSQAKPRFSGPLEGSSTVAGHRSVSA